MKRRQEDRPLQVVVPALPMTTQKARTVPGLEAGKYEVESLTGVLRSASEGSTVGKSDACLYLLDSGDEDLVLIAGLELERIPRERADLRQGMLSRAVVRHRAALHEARRVEALSRFVLLTERLTRASSRSEAIDALAEHAPAIVGGSAALVFSRSDDAPGTWQVSHSPIPLPPEAMTFTNGHLLGSAPGLVSADAVSTAAPILAATGASALAYAGIADSEILFIVERRSDRAFRAEDWYHLRLIARETEAALSRVRTA